MTELELNHRYTWQEIVEAYPDMYVYLRKVMYNEDNDITSAVLVAVATFEDRDAVFRQVLNDGDDFITLMTVCTMPSMGVLSANSDI